MSEEAESATADADAVAETGEQGVEQAVSANVDGGEGTGEPAACADADADEETGNEVIEETGGQTPEVAAESEKGDQEVLARVIEALLFLSSDPVPLADLAEAADVEQDAAAEAVELLGRRHSPGSSGLQLREVGGGYLLASAPEAEDAARRLFSRPRIATLTPAQTETLSIVAYLQPISRPEIGRIRGVSADSAAAALLERGLIEEAGRSQFGAALYKTTAMFLKLFGLRSLQELPDLAQWDPSPDEQAELRDRLLRAGEARAGGAPADA